MKTRKNGILRPAAFLGAILATLLQAANAQSDPLFRWDFNNNTDVSTANHGTASGGAITMVAHGGTNTAYFSADGAGRSGQSGDHAFDLTSSTGMGATAPNSTGPAGVIWSSDSSLQSLSGLTSFTLTGWINPATTLNNAARIISSSTLTLMAGSANQLALQVNGTSVYSSTAYTSVNSWMFFAVTYDSTTDIDNVVFYVGTDPAGTLSKAGTATLDAGALNTFTGQLLLGNNSTSGDTTRPFQGMMDDIAIYGATGGAAGALSEQQLNLIFNPSGIPEPSTWALLLGGATLVLAIIRRRK
ncbi:anchor protein [Opitutaceae bacterium TAV5]|nr:anchor protein [Opitutaceae bacterium TAV5]